MNLQMKSLRIRCGLKQEEIAERLQMPVRRYGSYERQERTLSLEDACAVADVLGCTLDELAGRVWTGAQDDGERELVECYRASTPAQKSALMHQAKVNRSGGSALNNGVSEEGVA